jgi:hypothetical protein
MAAPDATHMFSHWSGDLSGSNNPLTFTIGARDYAVIANFIPRTYTVTAAVSPAGTGSVSGTGTYPAGATATLTAAPDATHVFTGWSGTLSGSANPVSFAVNADRSVTANFASTNFTLTTAASGGGSVTPGGSYPPGSGVTISANGGASHSFTGWMGDASGISNPLLVTMNADKSITGLFKLKLAQTITFNPPVTVRVDPGNTVVVPLTATASSGLPVSFVLISGPASLTGSTLSIGAQGSVVVQADQPGDSAYLAAPSVQRTINGAAVSSLRQETRSDKVHGTETPGNATLIKTK